MKRVKICKGMKFSRIVYGMWRLGDAADTSPKHVQAKVEACLEQGITTFDQADIYGGYTAEAILGAALRAAPTLRDRMEIITKCGIVAAAGRHSGTRVKHYDTSAHHIASSVEQSLKDMGTDRIDLLLVHRPDPMMDHEETGAALDAMVASGKVRAVGVSNFRPWDLSLLQSAMAAPLVCNQIELSLAQIEPFSNGDLACCQERGITPMAWSPLGGGKLITGDRPLQSILDRLATEAGVDRTAVAVAWILAHPARILPIMGTNNLLRIRALNDAHKVTIDRETWFELYTAALGHEVA